MSKDKAVQQLLDDAIAVTKPTSYNFHITLDEMARYEAAASMKKRGIEVAEDFDGPHFKDIMGYQMGSEWVAVSLKDGTTYVYPANTISRIKHYIGE